MSLTDYVQQAPWPPYPRLPGDVLQEIRYCEVRADSRWLDVGTVRLTLRGGEVLEFPRTGSTIAIVDNVRKVARLREQAALEAMDKITDPVAARLALDILELAATRQRGCPCCGDNVPEGCILPPGADASDPSMRCTYEYGDLGNPEQCQCWGGPDRECEDCWLSSK